MGLFNLFKKQPEKKKTKPVEHVVVTDNEGHIDRRNIPADIIDRAQMTEASPKYRNYIHKKYFSDYPEKPFISQDRELYTNWEEQVAMFPDSIISKEAMTRFSDGLLPGHIYMLYWIHKIHRKRIPSYFEYEYGIQLEKEKTFLIKQGCLNQEGTITEQGYQALKRHTSVITDKTPSADLSFLTKGIKTVKKQVDAPSPALYSVPTNRIIPSSLIPGMMKVPAKDRKIIEAEFTIINKFIDRAIRLSRAKINLFINPNRFSYNENYSFYKCIPLTPSGKQSKYPMVLHYAYKEHSELLPAQDYFGEIYYLQNGSIGKARLIFWNHKDGYIIHLGIIKGILDVKKVEHAVNSKWVPIYKA